MFFGIHTLSRSPPLRACPAFFKPGVYDWGRILTVDMSRWMHDILGTYAEWFNFTRKRRGHLWQGRYKASSAAPAT